MPKQPLSTLKAWFEDGQRPTGEQFSDAWDSFFHLPETIDLMAPDASGVLATQEYVSNILDGLDFKQEAFCATTANITLSGIQNLDGTTGAEEVRVLVRAQTDQKQNGIYLMKSGSWERTSDADTGLKLQWAVVQVASGTTLGGKVYRCGVTDITIGSTNIVWTEWTMGSYTAGAGLSLSGNQFAVDSTVVRTSGDQSISGKKNYASEGLFQAKVRLLNYGGNAGTDSDYKTVFESVAANILQIGTGFTDIKLNNAYGGRVRLAPATTFLYEGPCIWTQGWNEATTYNAAGGPGAGSSGHNFQYDSNIDLTTSGVSRMMRLGNFTGPEFRPSSGSRSLSYLTLVGNVNQTGSASGVVSMLEIYPPTITSLTGSFYGIKSSVAFSSGQNRWNLYVDGDAPNYFAGDISSISDIVTSNAKAFYLGDKATNGTWRIRINGNDLVFERRESGSYVQKGIFSA